MKNVLKKIILINIACFFCFLLISTHAQNCNVEVLINKAYTQKLLKILKHAHSEIYISSFMWCCRPEKFYSYPCQILDILLKKIKDGLKVKIVFETDLKSDSLCNKTTYLVLKHTLLKKYSNLEIYNDSPLKRSHQKIFLVDGKYVFIGSHNITQSALKYNNEVSVLINSNKIYKKLKRFLEDVMAHGEKIY